MRQNMDLFDRFARITIGLALLATGAAGLARRDTFWDQILVVTGAAAVAGGVTAFSPGMHLIGLSACDDDGEGCEAGDTDPADEEPVRAHPHTRSWRKHSRFRRLCCPD
ncbi:MAG: DUF2892 domain-containing protein [Ignavibacteriales bacterium]